MIMASVTSSSCCRRLLGGCKNGRVFTFLWWVAWVIFIPPMIAQDTPEAPEIVDFQFTHSSYNASVSENAVGRTFVVPNDVMMGIRWTESINRSYYDIKFRIVDGDRDKFFKAEDQTVGDFCFLSIRTKSGHQDVLNRERKDEYRLIVRASLKPRARLKIDKVNEQVTAVSECEVIVTITDTNDLSPLFYPTEYETTVPEDTPVHSSIVRVTAEDADIGVNGQIYYSLLESTEQFAVHPTTGVVTLTRPLSFNERRRYELTVVAQDRGPKFRVSDFAKVTTAKLKIEVTEVNLHDPEIYINHLPTIVEDGNVRIYAIVKIVDRDVGIHGQIDKVEIVEGDPDGHFRVRAVPGTPNEFNIAILKLVDRELAPNGYNLTLSVTDKGNNPRTTLKRISVKVSDLNDHAPVCEKSEYRAEIEEIAPVNTPVLTVKATDVDEGKNAELVYQLAPEGNEEGSFSIDLSTGLISVAKPLDFETRVSYSLNVIVEDQSNSGMRKRNNCKVQVRVVDANDNDPVFRSSSNANRNGEDVGEVIEEASVKENEFIGTVVHTVKAEDGDTGDNGYVSYSIANINPTPFMIDHFSGEIKMKEVLDYEAMRRTYTLKIRASDWGTPYRRQSEMTVRVQLKDVNDNRPQFERVDCFGRISRDAPRATEIITLSAIDFDAGNVISYRFVSGNEDHCFALDKASGVVTLVCDLKSQKPTSGTTHERYLNFTATDGQHFADVLTVKVTVYTPRDVKRKSEAEEVSEMDAKFAHFQCRETGVLQRLTEMMSTMEKNNHPTNIDVLAQLPGRYGQNKHSPEFTDSVTSPLQLNENIAVGTKVLDLRAIDRDLGFNGQVVYAVTSGNVDGCFKIDLYNGTLSVAASLDRERNDVYNLNISAWDLGKPQKVTYKNVTVMILDANDNAPIFSKSSYMVTLPEDVANGTVVAHLTATDADVGQNANIRYTWSDVEDFYLDKITGIVTVTKPLDRERMETYELRVRAVDGSRDQPLTGTAAILMRVSDINDNPPKFSNEVFVARVLEDLPIGTVVTTLSAFDPDTGDGGKVQFSVQDGAHDCFKVDKETGAIRLAAKLDFEERRMYNISVSACDSGQPPLCSRASLIVEVVDVNENLHPPKFEHFVVSASVKENQPVGSIVVKVTATDDDKNPMDSQITYHIRGGTGLGTFTIDDKGVIRTSEVLDRESVSSYWLVVYAIDCGAVPLSSRVDVYVEVEDVNDNAPRPSSPIYFPSVTESSPPSSMVLQIVATDYDSGTKLTYEIKSGNPQAFFDIDPDTGRITTTSRRLDREVQSEFELEVLISDNGEPALVSSTRVVVNVADINDNAPRYLEKDHRIRIYEVPQLDTEIQLFRVIFQDLDFGPNADLNYSLKTGKLNGKFKIHPKLGVIYAQNLTAGQRYNFTVRAEDNGRPRKSSTANVYIEILPVPQLPSLNSPIIQNPNSEVLVGEDEIIGHVGDGFHYVYTQLTIRVVDVNDNRPQFNQVLYEVDVPENIPPGTEVIQIQATDDDSDKRMDYAVHSADPPSSYNKFVLDPTTGVLEVRERLDRETLHRHVLTVRVSDHGVPAKRNYARVIINVLDHNDHPPIFMGDTFHGKIFETSAIGSSVVQVLATDKDKGENGEITYSILSGNMASVFNLDPRLGLITVAKTLDVKTLAEYLLTVKATDSGNPPLSSTVPVHIEVTIADNAPPKFDNAVYSAEVEENIYQGSPIITINANSRSSVFYEIILGNSDGLFAINPNSGTISCTSSLDYEEKNFFNLTIRAVSMVNQQASCIVLVHVLDVNDNWPVFNKTLYNGSVTEAADIGTVVLDDNGIPLIAVAYDLDSELNSLLVYEIVEKNVQNYFTIDSSTGALKTAAKLDRETMSTINFTVQVRDMGRPSLQSSIPAHVMITIDDVNDCTPTFTSLVYNSSVLLPTHVGVNVATVTAYDNDVNAVVLYSIASGDIDNKFSVDPSTGVITLLDVESLSNNCSLIIRAFDGLHSSVARVEVKFEELRHTGLRFGQTEYFANVMENSTVITTVVVINVVGTELNEHVLFKILNPGGLFTIGETSGVVRTTGIPFDREEKETYVIAVEARSQYEPSKIAHTVVHINVIDINDNRPVFVNLPYFAVVPVASRKGDVIFKVHAIDVDISDNGDVSYELSGDRDEGIFQIHRKTGEVSLKRTVSDPNKEYNLIIYADDGGMDSLQTQTTLTVKVVHSNMPLFKSQYYLTSVLEDIQPYSPVISLQADSPAGRKLIYSIVDGNANEEFAIDFNTGVIYVVDSLDYERDKEYQLTIRATDSVSGEFSEVLLKIEITDVNDNAPQFSKSLYTASASETAKIGSQIYQIEARDSDSGQNKVVQYRILSTEDNDENLFDVGVDTGIMTLKNPFDYEKKKVHDVVVLASDGGVPTLNATVIVRINVEDRNDNAPYFEHDLYTCFLSEDAVRDQFVFMIMAVDPDISDQVKLSYAAVSGNEQQAFTVNKKTGIVSVRNPFKVNFSSSHNLNISVSDGVFTNYTRLWINVIGSNLHSPVFSRGRYDVEIPENSPAETVVAIVLATDRDRNAVIEYDIQCDHCMELFEIDSVTGVVTTKKSLDRETQEIYEIPVSATDEGGLMDFSLISVVLKDVNDNPPVFSVSAYEATVVSNATVGTNILKVNAVDIDAGLSATVEYFIYGNDTSGTNITELFTINRQTGDISLRRNALTFENQVFQFFVRAQDKGVPRIYSDVPVDIFIASRQDTPPRFRKKDSIFFLIENSPIGRVVTMVAAETNENLIYSLASSNFLMEDSLPFRINDQNEIVVAGPLDRETKDTYLLVVKAETQTSPPLTAYANYTVQIMDDNDNRPEFECNPYYLTVSENVKEGHSIVRVVARDKDAGHNSEVRYSLESVVPPPSETDATVPFDVNAHTGWITNLVKLDHETTPVYTLKISATDGGSLHLSSMTTVRIEVKDYNDSPPVFSQSHYRATVNEDASVGTVVMNVMTNDADEGLSARIAYYITSGDPNGHFGIRYPDELYVNKELDREKIDRYELQVTATDGKFVTNAKVTLDLLDANDNPPICKMPRYKQRISEAIAPGTIILSVEAFDGDDAHNARLRYYLSGAEAHDFIIDVHNGSIRTAKSLDRELVPHYLLTVTVQDKDYHHWNCQSEIDLILTDVNDNSPEFTQITYSVTVPEDTEVKMLVSKVHATDKDLGINRKVRYSFVDSANGHFSIDSLSGIITLAKPLDREERAMYNLTVRATDMGTPQLSTMANLLVIVLDINDNPPEFASKYYYTSVSENAKVGSDIVRVLATSKDSGVNAEITYAIVGGNEYGMFHIHQKTGVVGISKALDYEKAREYLLTIQANDGGTPSLSNHATVNITITDANDNAPVFTQNVYSATVREDAQVGDRIIKVLARDADSSSNGKITYFIAAGDAKGPFKIEKYTGYLIVGAPLDRETVSKFKVEVHAIDSGIPQLSSSVIINIEVADTNDNPPIFSSNNYTAIVREDRDLGFTILKLTVTDADLPHNGQPFTYEIRRGNEGNEFRMVQDDTLVTVKVIEESQYPPVATPIDININSYLDEFPGGIIGKVHARDQDPYDTLSFVIVSNHRHLFDVDPDDGTLKALPGLDVGHYNINVSASDGKFYTYVEAKVSVVLITDEMLENAIVLRLQEVTPDEFVVSYYKSFLKALRNAFSVRQKDVEILGIQPSREESYSRIKRQMGQKADLDVMLSVHKPKSQFYSVDALKKVIIENKDKLETVMELKIVRILDDLCEHNPCKQGQCKANLVFASKAVVVVSTPGASYVYPKHLHQVDCICKEGFGGKLCEVIVNECAHATCPSYKICVPDTNLSSYTCQCPPGKIGPRCSKDISNCVDDHCYEEKNPVSFRGKSYAAFTLNNSMDRHLALSLKLKTVQPRSCIMYAAGRIDYSILEVVNGFIQYRFDCGSGEGLVRLENVWVSNGQWHSVSLSRRGNVAELVVDNIPAYGSAPGHNDVLNIETNDVYFGAEVRPYPLVQGYDDIRMGYVGCLDDIQIEGVALPLKTTSGSSSAVAQLKRLVNIERYCHPTPTDLGICGSQPCFNGGTCKGISDTNYVCHCHVRFTGYNCEIDTNPCASSPCLNDGKCTNQPNDFNCSCPTSLSGKRCEYGRHCNPNPCLHGGICEEATYGPICKCKGYTGERCSIDHNECSSLNGNPCQNGATCINMPGSYQCICRPNTTGGNCETIVIASGKSIASGGEGYGGITFEEIVGIITTVIGILLLALIFILIRKCRLKRARQRQNNAIMGLDGQKEMTVTNPGMVLKNKTGQEEIKRTSKVSNLEVYNTTTGSHIHRGHPAVGQRPLSYTPSNHDTYSGVLNNYETVRSYGSAGDDLENINRFSNEFIQTINKPTSVPPNLPPPPPSNSPSDSESLHKPWSLDNNLKDNYCETKIQNDLKCRVGLPEVVPLLCSSTCADNYRLQDSHPPGTTGQSLCKSSCSTGVPHSSLSEEEYLTGYHWDCSDWARSQNPLPNITEVPTNEVPDSPSVHSNESNNGERITADVDDEDEEECSVSTVLLGPVNRHGPGITVTNNASNRPQMSNEHSRPLLSGLGPMHSDEEEDDADSEYVGDSEVNDLDEPGSREPIHLNFERILPPLEMDSYNLPQSYHRHPDQYLPSYNGLALDTDAEENSSNHDGRSRPRRISSQRTNSSASAADANLYGFLGPQRTSNGVPGDHQLVRPVSLELAGSNIDDMLSVSVGGYNSTNASCSDISANMLCEIDDSEMCSELDLSRVNTVDNSQSSIGNLAVSSVGNRINNITNPRKLVQNVASTAL
ncbi:hypothetical protein CHUAL_012768 [Chamberlinius hualienensis]